MSLSRSPLTFGPFRLESEPMRLWRGGAPVALQPRPLAVLCYLAARPDMVVGSHELLARVWSDACVTRAVLKVAVRALRAALGDDATAPRFVETVGRDGYRFIGARRLLAEPGTLDRPATAPALVGRVDELARLRAALRQSGAGRRTVVLVSGVAGSGKTALIEQCLAEAAADPAVCIARGYCPETTDGGEDGLPLIEAMTRLVREQRGFGAILRRYAPSCAAVIPALGRRGTSSRRPRGATDPAHRMVREIADALEAFSARRPLVLVLEDLQWSDPATLATLAGLARNRHPARLLVIASARPAGRGAGVVAAGASDALLARGVIEELPLGRLTADDVATYVALRFAGAPDIVQQRLATHVHDASAGNALFMVALTNDLLARGLHAWRTGPWPAGPATPGEALPLGDGIRALLARQLAALRPDDLRLLEAASVIGDEFGADELAAVLGAAVEAVEARCDDLAAQAMLIAEGDPSAHPGAAPHGRYRFRLSLHRRALHDGIGRARRARLQHAFDAWQAGPPTAVAPALELATSRAQAAGDAGV